MKRILLLVVSIAMTACLSLYIIDYRLPGSNRIGFQDDLADDVAPGLDEGTLTKPSALSVPPQPTTAAALPTPAAARLYVPAATAEPAGETDAPYGWQLVWADEFDKPQLNMEYWTEIDRRNNYNGELQYFSPSNSFVEDGKLILEARKEKKSGRRYTSGMVQTLDKLSIQYGRMEARLSLPVGKGFFPAFWLLADEDRYEIDVMEMIGSEPTLIYGCNHYMKGKTVLKNWGMTTVEDPEAFHVYAAEWDQDCIRWYVDGQLYFSTETGVPDEDMYMILTLAVGGDWPGSPNAGTVFPSRMAVDYIRYYRAAENTEGQVAQ